MSGQIAALRNPIRHRRHIDEIAFKDGEAGVIWFERMLGKPEGSLDVNDAEEKPPTAT